MKRRVDVCLGCPRLIAMKGSGGSGAVAFCCNVRFGSDICQYLEGIGARIDGVAAEESVLLNGGRWERRDVPSDCNFYERYFLMDCNK